MKAVLYNGSPKKKGSCSKFLLDYIQQKLHERNWDTTYDA